MRILRYAVGLFLLGAVGVTVGYLWLRSVRGPQDDLAWAARGGHTLGPHYCQAQSVQHLQVVRFLLDHSADPLIADANGWRPERVARHHHQDESAALLGTAASRAAATER